MLKVDDIVIVKEDADWSPKFKHNRKFIVSDFTNRDNFNYALRTYNWPYNLRNEVFNNSNDYVFITELDAEDLIVLDKNFIKDNTIKKLEIQ